MFFVISYPKNEDGWSYSVYRTVEAFTDLDKAQSFVDIWRNKGYICILYKGEKI